MVSRRSRPKRYVLDDNNSSNSAIKKNSICERVRSHVVHLRQLEVSKQESSRERNVKTGFIPPRTNIEKHVRIRGLKATLHKKLQTKQLLLDTLSLLQRKSREQQDEKPRQTGNSNTDMVSFSDIDKKLQQKISTKAVELATMTDKFRLCRDNVLERRQQIVAEVYNAFQDKQQDEFPELAADARKRLLDKFKKSAEEHLPI